MTSDNYKEAKEAFVSGVVGSSITQINLISLVSFISIGVHADVIRSRTPRPVSFVLEWTILVLPVLLSVTLFAHRPLLLSALTLAAQWPLTHIVSRFPHTRPSSEKKAQSSYDAPASASGPRSLAALSSYRAHMMLLTTLAILAVDFPVFPRFLAKCESFGTSMMDLGVGAFVFSQGVVSAIPILKDPAYLDAPLLPKLFVAIRKVAPLAALGLVRVLLVKGTDYPEHVTEYGVHWNFFLTLAILPPLQILLHGAIARMHIASIALGILAVHQSALSFTPLQSFALNAPRTDLFSMNREGIISLPGYLAIHLLGLLTGMIVIPPTPSHFRRARRQLKQNEDPNEPTRPLPRLDAPRDNSKTSTELLSYSFLFWTFVVGIVFARGNDVVSRRLANMPYVLWTAAYNTTAIGIYILLEMLQHITAPRPPPRDESKDADLHEPPPPQVTQAPALFEAINRNGLLVFLFANVMTGVVNLSMKTMYAGDALAMIVLCVYSLAVCGVAWALRGKRVISL